MRLSAGDKLGPYEIAELIGKGGMGEVYRARDSRLRRDVAIKVSSRQFSERFEREARAVAALNHPNICTLYDVGPNYLVMELVEGPTLAQRIKEEAMPLDEAMAVGRQITAALEAAHEKGITHRDLKPGNVKIKSDGLVKVLDFGLAKMELPAAGDSEDSPTVTMMTENGMVLGTAAYMSPEQARARSDVDKRADIWAFGVVFFEMLTRKRLFTGESVTDILAAVVNKEPDLGPAPAEVRRLLWRCLEKDPRKRLRDISVIWELVEDRSQAQSRATASKLPWVAAAVLGVAAIGLGAMLRDLPAPMFAANEFVIHQPPNSTFSGTFAALSVSPDGRFVVFGATVPGGPISGALWLRPLDSLEARLLPGTEGGSFPFWSPDSKSIVFASGTDRKLKRIEIAGGAPLVLTHNQAGPISPVGAWNRDGVILYGSVEGLQRIAPSGGAPALITKVNAGAMETGHGFPQFLPDGKRFLYFVASNDAEVQGVYAASLDRPEQRALVLRTGAKAVYAPPRGDAPGYLLWMQEKTLVAQRFDSDALRLEGDPVAVAQDIAFHPSISIRAAYWAEGGTLAYRTAGRSERRPVIWMSAKGKALGEVMPSDHVDSLKVSPDGSKMVMVRRVDGGAPDIWVRDLASGNMTRLTFDSASETLPVWSPDGRQVAFGSDRDGIAQIYRKDASGTGQLERVTDGPYPKGARDWSRDGKYLLYTERKREGDQDLLVLPLDGSREPIVIAGTSFIEANGEISPDGRWIVYSSQEFRRAEVFVRPAPWVPGAADGRWQVSNGGGAEPKWREDGGEIYYRSGFDFFAAAVNRSKPAFQTDQPRKLFTATTLAALNVFDVTPDGRKFALIMPPPDVLDNGPLTVVTNWQARIGR